MTNDHHVIYVPGLHDQHIINKNLMKLLPLFWKPFGITTHIIALHWEEGRKFVPKLQRITDMIDSLVTKGYTVSLIGQSAGGSAVMNAYVERRDVLNGVVNITGRLRSGNNVHPSLKQAAQGSQAFAESVLLFEQKNEPNLTTEDRKKIVTIRPFWDEVVPAATVPIEGAENVLAPFPQHSLGGVLICILFARKIFNFLEELRIER